MDELGQSAAEYQSNLPISQTFTLRNNCSTNDLSEYGLLADADGLMMLAQSTRCTAGGAAEVPEFGERCSNNTLSLQVNGTGVFFIQFHYNAVLFSGIYF